MNIILGTPDLKEVSDKYIVLSLDQFSITGKQDPITAYCLVESLPLNEMFEIKQCKELHENLMINYRKKNWNFCEQAISHLRGKWNGELDSFYQTLWDRINKYQSEDPGDAWDGTIDKTIDTV